MKKTVQQELKRQEPTTHIRTKQLEVLINSRQSDSGRFCSVRNTGAIYETLPEKGNILRNGTSCDYGNESVKSGSSDIGVDACGVITVVGAKTGVCDTTVVNGTPSLNSPVRCSDTIYIAENVNSTQCKTYISTASLRVGSVDPEKAQDRLLKSQSHIEQLQQNLATKLSAQTVETFRHEYSPTIGSRSPSRTARSLLIDSKQSERDSHDSCEAVGSSYLAGDQQGRRTNRETRVYKDSVGKGETSVSESKLRKLAFLGSFFGRSGTRPSRELSDPRKSDSTDGTAKNGQILNRAGRPLENISLQLGSEKRQGGLDDSCPRIKGEVTGKTTDTYREATVPSAKSSSQTPLGDAKCRKLSDVSVRDTYTVPEAVYEVPLPKPARVSWTTRLIQKLTEEEEKKKARSESKVEKPKHIVRFPQKKVNTAVNQNKGKTFEESKKELETPPVLQLSSGPTGKVSDTGSDSTEKELKENPSGVVLEDNIKDAYASVLSQLTESEIEDSQQVSEQSGEDILLKQRNLEEIRATLAREECASTSSDDDSIITSAITASTGSIGAGRRKESKPSGIRRLLPQGLFVQKQRNNDRADEGAARERLLKHYEPPRVYPASNTGRPVLETAFLSDSYSKLPVRTGVQQQQRSQSSSPSSRHKQVSPRSRRRQRDLDQKTIQENEQNSSRISYQVRSKSLSPARDRRSSAKNATPKRTTPVTSLVLEERFQLIRRELSPPPARDVKRPSSTPPYDHLKRLPQGQNPFTPSPSKGFQQDRTHQNASTMYSDAPDGAYYHSPPSRRRQQSKHPDNDYRVVGSPQKVSGGSSASSTSTMVAESPPVNALSWNPLLLNLENQALSGSPDIRKLQQQRHPHDHHQQLERRAKHSELDGQKYEDIENPGTRVESQDIYYHSVPGLARKPQRSPQAYNVATLMQLSSPTPVPSGRFSAPPVSSDSTYEYLRRRVISPEPPRTRPEYDLPSNRSFSHPPASRRSNQTSSAQPSLQPSPVADERISPVPAHLLITSQLRPSEDDKANNKETQTARSYMEQQYRQLGEGLRNASSSPYKKISPQEVEALYWETQRLRVGLSSLSQSISHAPRLGERYLSTASLPPTSLTVHHSSKRSEQNSPISYQPEVAPRRPFRTQSVHNVGGGYGSLVVRPQPMYNIDQPYQLLQQSHIPNDSNIKASRARSVSPGPNSNRLLPSRSLSLPRNMPAPVIPERSPHKASDGTVDYFKRGVPQRNTIGPIRTTSHSPQVRQLSTPTIYEEQPQQIRDDTRVVYADRHKHASKAEGGGGNRSNKVSNDKSLNPLQYMMNRSMSRDVGDLKKPANSKKNKKSLSEVQIPQRTYYPPIFKRGSLVSTSTCSVDGGDSSLSPKRVSFTSMYNVSPPNWPTRNGPAPEPPTRQRKSQGSDSDVFLSPEEFNIYGKVPEAPNRPLPPVPREENASTYGMILKKSRDSKPAVIVVPYPAHRWQQQSESESGSEAGEVQRILQQGSHSRGTYFRFAASSGA